MLTAKQAMDGLLTAGLCTTGSVKRQKRQDGYPAYTRVEGRGRVHVGEETYGSESEMYLRCEDEAVSQEAQTLLKGLGGKPYLGWGDKDNSCHFSCAISPIKGWHWWE